MASDCLLDIPSVWASYCGLDWSWGRWHLWWLIDWLVWFLSRTIGNSLHISSQSNFVCCCLYFVGMNKLACHLNYWFLKWGRWGRSAMLFGEHVLLLLGPRPKFDAGFPDVISYMESWFCMNDVTSHLCLSSEIKCVSVVRYCNLKIVKPFESKDTGAWHPFGPLGNRHSILLLRHGE